MKIPHLHGKLNWLALVFALCVGQVSAQTGATIELDEDGWTVFTLRQGGNIYYVSSSGSDSNNGLSEATPFKTINWGLSRMAGGDWLLLKRGDTFLERMTTLVKNGPSPEHKTLIGAYGDPSAPRPIIDPSGGQVMTFHGGNTGGNPIRNWALVSLHFYQSRRDLSSPNYVAGTGGGSAIQLFPNGDELLFEDLRIDYFSSGINLQGDANRSDGGIRGLNKITLRRCIIANNYSNDYVNGPHSQGMYCDAVFDFLIEENFFDHNGHNPGLTNSKPTIFNHNMYINSSCGPNILVRRNIIARAASHGIQLRPGGTIEENVFIHNGIAGFVADNRITAPASQVMAINNNVVLEGATWALYSDATTFGTRAWGLALEATDTPPVPDTVEMKNNIVTNAGSMGLNAYQVANKLQSSAEVSGNITYNWGSASNTPGIFPFPERTSGSYNASVGGEATMLAYLTAVGQRRKGNWNPDYTWEPLHSYINEGFGRTTGTGPVTGVTVLPETISIPSGDSEQISATIAPFDAAEKGIVWSSSDTSIATVGASTGIVTAVALGTATITATTVDGGFTDTCVVTVLPSLLKMVDVAYMSTPPVIDGSIDEWADVEGSAINRLVEGTVADANDISGVFKAAWDETYFYVNIQILDNVLQNSSTLNAWVADGVELALNLNNNTTYNLLVAGTNDGEGKFSWVYGDTAAMTRTSPNRLLDLTPAEITSDYQLAFTTITGGYALEARIAWSNLDTDFVAALDTVFEAEIFVNDNDDGAAARKAVISWSGIPSINSDNSEFGQIRLVGEQISGPKNISIVYAENPPVIDGSTTEWNAVPGSSIVRIVNGEVADANDISGVFKAVWDNTYLYVNVKILDNVLQNSPSLNPWVADGVELALNLNNNTTYNLINTSTNDGEGKFSWVYGDTAAMTLTSPSRLLDITVSQITSDYQLMFTDITGGYELEARIPWSNLDTGFIAQNNVVFEAEIFVNDNDDGTTRKSVISWSGLQNINSNNTEFGKIRLVGEIATTQNFWSLIGASVEDTGASIYFSSWFGYFKEMAAWNGAWIQHDGLAWLYTGAVTGEDVWAWSPHIETWLYTSEDYFPWVWVRADAESSWTDANGSGWMYFAQPDSSAPGWLYSHSLQEWATVVP